MDDDALDTGTPGRKASPPQADPSDDEAARDLEFELFYSIDLPRLVGFLVVQGARPCVAAELAQDSMVEAYRQWDAIDTPRTWVRTVASRKWWQYARRERFEVLQEELRESYVLLSAEESAEIESRQTFVQIVRSLPPVQRTVMAWTYDGYQPTEIAAVLGKQPATVRSTLRAARAALRKIFPPEKEGS